MSSPEPQILRYTRWLREQRGLDFDPTTTDGYDAPVALVVRRPARLLAIDLRLLRDRVADAARHRAGRRDDARRASGSPARRSTTRGTCSAMPSAATPPAIRRSSFATRRCRRTARRSRSPGPSCAARWRRSRRRCRAWAWCRGDRVVRRPAQPAADRDRLPRLRQPGRGLVGVLGRHGAAGDPRPLPPDRAQGGDRRRRLLSTAASPPTALPVLRGLIDELPSVRHVVLLRHLDAEADARLARRSVARGPRLRRAGRRRPAVRAGLAAVRPSALDRLFERHHRAAEGDRARPRRGDARGPEDRPAQQPRRRAC